MKTIKTYRYLIKPTKIQIEEIDKIFKNTLFVYNRYVDDVKKGKDMKRYAKDILKEYKNKNPVLNDTDSSALMNVLFQISSIDRSKLNKIKARNLYTTSKLNYGTSFYVTTNNELYLPKVGIVKMVMHRDFPIGCEFKSVTIKKDNTENYYACFILEYNNQIFAARINVDNTIGLDYSSTYLFVDSNGKKAMIPHFYRKQQQKLAYLQKKLAKKEHKSLEYYKLKEKISRAYKKIKNQRNDWLHKASSDLVNQYDIICMESLDMIEMAKKETLAKATYDNSFGLFRKMLEYKAKERGKKIVYIDKWYPSSKTCNVCGSINYKLALDDREWKCEKCGSIHDRDVNSAINIREEGKRKLLLRDDQHYLV